MPATARWRSSRTRPERRRRGATRRPRLVRSRQVDPAADRRRPGAGPRRDRVDRRPDGHRPAAGPAERGHGLPVLRAVPASVGRRQHRVRAGRSRRAQGRGPGSGPARSRSSSGATRCSTAGRASCPAASGSGWRWLGHWSASLRCCCWTSRCPTSTPSCAPRPATSYARCTSGSAARSCTSRTTRARHSAWATGSPCCSTGGSRRPAPPTSSGSDRRAVRWPGFSGRRP